MKVNKEFYFRYILIGIFVLFFYTIPAFFIPKKLHFKFLYPLFWSLYLWAPKIRIHNLSKININSFNKKPVIFASNHKSYADSAMIGRFLKLPYLILINREITKNIFFKIIAWRMGLIPISRNMTDTISQRKALEACKKGIKNKYSLIIYPEGKHHYDKPIGKLKRGIIKIITENNSDVVPVALYGVTGHFVFEKKLIYKDAYLKVGEPIKYSDYKDEKSFLDELQRRIEELYLQLQQEVD